VNDQRNDVIQTTVSPQIETLPLWGIDNQGFTFQKEMLP
jgi:hypothetical protein